MYYYTRPVNKDVIVRQYVGTIQTTRETANVTSWKSLKILKRISVSNVSWIAKLEECIQFQRHDRPV